MTDRREHHPLAGAERLLEPGVVDQVRLAWRLLRDPRVPWIKNVLPAFAALYLLSPIDVVPDLFVGLGQIDDVGIAIGLALATIRLLPKLAPPEVVAEHLADLRGRAPGPTGQTYEGSYRIRD